MLTLLAGIDLDYRSRLGELLREGGAEVAIAASFEGCYRFLERSQVDVIVLGVRAGEAFPFGLPRPSASAALLVLTEGGFYTVPHLPTEVTYIERPADPQELLEPLALLFEQSLRDRDQESGSNTAP